MPQIFPVDARAAKVPVFGVIAAPPLCDLSTEARDRLDSMLGVALAACIAMELPLSETFISAWATLRRCGLPNPTRSRDWDAIATVPPLSLEAIQSAIKTTRLAAARSFLVELERYTETGFVATAASPTVGSSSNPPDLLSADSAPFGGDEADDEEAQDSGDDQEITEQGADPKGSFIHWHLTNAWFAPLARRAGVAGTWDQLTVRQLKRSCHWIANQFDGQPGRVPKHGAFATCSLLTRLPARLLRHLPLASNDDVWLGIEQGYVYWNYRRVLTGPARKTPSGNPAEAAASPAVPAPMSQNEIIPIPLPAAVAECLRRALARNPGAATLGELLIGSKSESEIEQWLEAYRRALRLSGDSNRQSFDARFANSLGPAYLELTASDVLATLLAFDFAPSAPGMLHYLTLTVSWLHGQASMMYQTLGLGPAVEAQDITAYVGSPITISPRHLRAGWDAMLLDSKAAVDEARDSADITTLAKAFSTLAEIRQLAVLTLSAHRGTKLAKMTLGSVCAHPGHMRIRDKDHRQYSLCRVIPCSDMLAQIIDGHLADLELLVESASRAGVPLSGHAARRTNRAAGSGLAFFRVEVEHSDSRLRLVRRLIPRPRLEELATRYFGAPLNIGRHFLISELVMRRVDRWLLRVLTGQARGNAEPFAHGMAIAPVVAFASLKEHLDKLIAEIGLVPLPRLSGPAKQPAARLERPPCSKWDPFVEGSESSSRPLPAYSDFYTLTSWTVVARLQTRYAAGALPQPGAALMVTLLIFDAIHYPEDLKQIWKAEEASFRKLGATIVASWARPDHSNKITSPLSELTVLGLAEALPAFDAWPAALRAVVDWCKHEVPELDWPATTEEAFATLCAMVGRWARLHLPPYVAAAYSRCLPAATYSDHSLARLAAPENSRREPEALTLPRPQANGIVRASKSNAMDSLCKAVNKWGSNDKALGEERARATGLLKALDRIDCSAEPRTEALKRWHHHEATLTHGGKAGCLQISSLSTYNSALQAAMGMLSPMDDPLDWEAEEFDSFVVLVASTAPRTRNGKPLSAPAAQDALENRMNARRRFFRALKSFGAEVPPRLLHSEGGQKFEAQRRSASAVFIGEADCDTMERLLRHALADHGLDLQRALLLLEVRMEVPLRTLEAKLLNADSLTDDLAAMTTEPEGFSHIKSYAGLRESPIHLETGRRMRELTDLVSQRRPPTKWLFLDENARECTDGIAHTALVASLRATTNDPAARGHSFRGAATCRRAVPGWEPFVGSLLRGEANTSACRSFIAGMNGRGFTQFIEVALHAGHSSTLTTVVYYLPVWVFLRAAALRAAQGEIDVTRAMAVRCGKTPAGLRQARHRGLDLWAWLALGRGARLSLSRIRTDQRSAGSGGPPIDSGLRPQALRLVRYTMLRLHGLDPFIACDMQAVPVSHGARMDAVCDHGSLGSTLGRRVRGSVSQRSQGADISMVMSATADRVIEKLLGRAPEEVQCLWEAIAATGSPRDGTWAGTPSGPTLETHLDCLPAELGLHVRFGRRAVDATQTASLRAFAPRLSVGPPDRDLGDGRRLLVTDVEQATNRVAQARLTTLVRTTCVAVLAYQRAFARSQS